MPTWNPNQYLKFKNERTQPALDLISRINLENPATILDLGCGPGNSTAALRHRWPDAKVTGLDNSPEMIAAALKDYPQGEWILGDIATFQPAAQSDLIFANATLQWLHHHETLLPRLFSFVRFGGALAVQVPASGDSPLAKAVVAVAARPAWREHTAGCERLINYRTPDSDRTSEYHFQILRQLGSHFEIWQTTYYHILASQQGLIEWYRGTGMKPYLDRLPDDAARQSFEDEVLREISPSYPVQADGRVLFPFKRSFFTIYK
jgi:trans-aconitate 2-methyltransferase